MDRQRARTCPGASFPGGTGPASDGDTPKPGPVAGRATWRGGRWRGAIGALLVTVVAAVALVNTAGTASASPPDGSSPALTVGTSKPALVLLAQTDWVTAGQVFDLHLRTDGTGEPTADLGINVSVYSCLSSVSGFDQSVDTGPTGTPLSSTPSPIPVRGLPPLAGGGFNLAMPVVANTSESGSTTPVAGSPFTIQLLPVGDQCQSYPAGVFPVRVQLVDISNSTVISSFTTHLVFANAPADTEHLRVAVVLPVQIPLTASRVPTSAELLARPAAALATPPATDLAAVAATVATIATQHQTVPVTLQVSGQTVGLLAATAHSSTLVQLAQLASSPDVHQLTAAPFAPVDATALVDTGLASELKLQVSRGVAALSTATDRPTDTSSGDLGPWITGDGLDPGTVSALAGDGYSQVVVPASALTNIPATGSSTEPFALNGSRGSGLTAMASDNDLTSRFASDPGNPVLAAHQLMAELAQIYYELPNGNTPRAVMVVAPASWSDNPAFVDALLGSLDGNPVLQAVTTSQIFAMFTAPAACHPSCKLITSGGPYGLPVAAIRAQRARVNGFADAATGAHALSVQLGDLVLGGEAQALRPAQQSAVVANAGDAVDAQVGQLAVEGNQTVTLTARSGTVPVTVVSGASYPVSATLTLSCDKLLFSNAKTLFSKGVVLLPHHSNVTYVAVRSRASGVFRLDVSLRSPDGQLHLATGELSVRSTSSSVVGVVLTIGAVVVLAVWWFRTSVKRRAARRAEEEGDGPEPDSDEPQPAPIDPAARIP